MRMLLFFCAVLVALSCQLTFRAPESARERHPRKTATDSASAPFAVGGQVEGVADLFDPRSMPFSPDGRLFVRRTGDTVRVYDALTLKPNSGPLVHPGLGSDVNYYFLTRDGRSAVTVGAHDVRVWDIESSSLRGELKRAPATLMSAVASPEGGSVVTAELADATSPVLIVHRINPPQATRRLSRGLVGGSLSIDPTGIFVASFGEFAEYRCWRMDTGQEVFSPMPPTHAEASIEFAPAGKRLLLPRDNGFATIDLDSGKILLEKDLDARVASVRLAPDGDRVAVMMFWGQVRVCDTKTGAVLREIDVGPRHCEMSRDARWLLCDTFLSGSPPQLWDLTSGKLAQVFPAPGDAEVHLSPDGKTILISRNDGVTQVWRQTK